MITHFLFDDTALSPAWRRFFPEPFLLRKLGEAGLPVVRFAVSSPALYREYRRTGRISLAAVQHVVEHFLTGYLSDTKRIVIRCPFVDANIPLPEQATVSLGPTAIRGVIESFYRAWQSEKVEHYRTAEGIPETVVPILLLHRECGETGLAFSRSPRTGERMDQSNWESGWVNAVNRLAPETALNLRASEKLLHYPVALKFNNASRKKPLTICGVQRLELTAECSLRALIEMLQDGELTLSEFLSQMDVSWFRGVNTFGVRPPSFKAMGVAACPGVAFAPAYLRPTTNSPIPNGGIFVVKEVSPEDLDMIISSEAVVATAGSVSSHATLVCRQMGKPCVVGVSALEIDYTTRTIRSNGSVATEGTLCMVNGETGEVALLVGGGETVSATKTLAGNTLEHLKALQMLFSKIPEHQMKRLTGAKAEVLGEIQSLFDLIDEP